MHPTVLDKESTFNFAAIEPYFILKCLQNLPDRKGVDVLGMDNHLIKLAAPIIIHSLPIFSICLYLRVGLQYQEIEKSLHHSNLQSNPGNYNIFNSHHW